MDLFSTLRESYLTNGLSDDEVRTIEAISETVEYTDLDEIIREFDEACDVFILVGGKARVATSSGDLITRLQLGAIIGEIGLFSKEMRTASVLCDGEATVVKISGERLNALLDSEPTIGVKVLRNVGKTLCEHLRSSNVQLETVLSVL